MKRGREVEAELGGNAAIFGNHQGSDQNPASFMGGLNILNIQLFQNHCNAMKLVELRTGSLDYKTIWLMLYLSSLSMSFIFRALILSIPVTWISHLYYGYWFYYILQRRRDYPTISSSTPPGKVVSNLPRTDPGLPTM